MGSRKRLIKDKDSSRLYCLYLSVLVIFLGFLATFVGCLKHFPILEHFHDLFIFICLNPAMCIPTRVPVGAIE